MSATGALPVREIVMLPVDALGTAAARLPLVGEVFVRCDRVYARTFALPLSYSALEIAPESRSVASFVSWSPVLPVPAACLT